MEHPYKASHDTRPEAMAQRLQYIVEDMGELKESNKRVAEALEKLVLLEERQRTTASGLDRAFSAHEKLDARVRVLELAQPKQDLFSGWVEKGVLVILGAVLMAIIKGQLGVTP